MEGTSGSSGTAGHRDDPGRGHSPSDDERASGGGCDRPLCLGNRTDGSRKYTHPYPSFHPRSRS